MGSNADLVRRLTNEVFVGGDVAVIDELMTADFVSHDPPPGMAADRSGQRAIAELVVAALSERSLEFDDYLEAADGRVVESWAMLGTHTGEAFGLPPSGERVRVRGIEIWRCAEGKIVEHWASVDMSDLFEKAQSA